LVNGKGLTNGRGKINGRGLINGNGLTNGRGKVNGRGPVNGKGLVNGRGQVNGQGIVNGNGLVNGGLQRNGRGIVNGNGLTNGLRLWRNRFGVVTHRELKTGSVLFVAFLIIIPAMLWIIASMAPTPKSPEPQIEIDGDFSDWDSIEKYSETLTIAPQNINILNYAVNLSDQILNIYLKIQTNFFPYENPDVFEIFFDADGDWTTGYEISEDFGSDYRIELYGWDGMLKGWGLSKFSGTDNLNFSAWERIRWSGAAINLNELEAQIDTSALQEFQDDFRIFIQGKDFEGRESSTSVTPMKTFGALVVKQSNILQNPVTSGTRDVTRLSFISKGSAVNVTGVTVLSSAGIVDYIGSFNVPANSIVTKNVGLDVTGLSDGTLVTVKLAAVEADRAVRITGRETRVYVDSYPSSLMIDGLFEDWTSNISDDNGYTFVNNQNIDITRYSATKNNTNAYFYLQTEGKMLAGTSIPRKITKPIEVDMGPAKEPVEEPEEPLVLYIPRKTGEDVTRIYIDTNSSDSNGKYVGDILADRMMEIRGIYGKITSRTYYGWANWTWNIISNDIVEAEIDETQLESSIPLKDLGELWSPEVVFETTDWKGVKDSTDVDEGLRSGDSSLRKRFIFPFALESESTKFSGDGDNQFIVTSTQDSTAELKIDTSSKRISMKFTAQTSLTVTDIRYYLGSTLGSPNIRSGLQGDSSGEPSGSWLGSGNGYADSTSLAAGWNTLTLEASVSTAADTIYHMVLQYAGSGQVPDSSNYIIVRATTPNNNIYPKDGNSDTATDVMTYDGASWTSQDFQPIYILETAAHKIEGNPYHGYSEKNIFGTSNAWGNRFTIGSDRSFSQAKFYLKKVGTPAGDITMRIRNIDFAFTVTSVTLTAASVGTTYGWVTFDFTSVELWSGTSYRIYLESTSSADSSNCYVTPAAVTTGAPYRTLSYDGTTTKQTQIPDTSDPDTGVDTDANDIPFQLLPEFEDLLLPIISMSAFSMIIIKRRRKK